MSKTPRITLALLAGLALAVAGCDSKDKTHNSGPTLNKAAAPTNPAGVPKGAAEGTANSGGVPQATGASQLVEGAAMLELDATGQAVLDGAPPLPLLSTDGKIASEVAQTLGKALAASRGSKTTPLNLRLHQTLSSTVLWALAQVAARAGYAELRLALSSGALAIQMPQAVSPKAPLPKAGHLALTLSPAGLSAKVFVGPSSPTLFPVLASAGGKALTTQARSCPAAPRPPQGKIPPAVVRTLGEPVCLANGPKAYWVTMAPMADTSLQEFAVLTAAAASPSSGCTPSVAMVAPRGKTGDDTSSVKAACGGAMIPAAVKAFVSSATGASRDLSAVARAVKRPPIKSLDPALLANKKAPAMAEKLGATGSKAALAAKAKAAGSSLGSVALGRVATSDGDKSRVLVVAGMKKHLADVKACYLDYLKAADAGGAPFAGVMTMGMQITAQGRPNKPGFKKTGDVPTSLKLCVSNKVKGWLFDAPVAGKPVQAMIPVVLRAPKSTAP